MDDSTAVLILCIVLAGACVAGMVYLVWDVIECAAAFLAALVSDWWRARRGPPAPYRAPCGHECPYHPPAPSWAPSDAAWQRDLELTR